MGDRISISFSDGYDESVALFSHSDGLAFRDMAIEYLILLRKNRHKDNNIIWPLDRLEPRTVIVDFIRLITFNLSAVKSNYYLGHDQTDGDNGDNGHWVIDVKTAKAKRRNHAEMSA